jgi:hypothetical protein
MTWPFQRSTVSPAAVQRERAYFSRLQYRAVQRGAGRGQGRQTQLVSDLVPVNNAEHRGTTQRGMAGRQHASARYNTAQRSTA